MELEVRRPLMLKEWMELESSAELSSDDGFGCYPRRHLLAAELRSASGRRRGGDVITRVSAAVRAALFRPPPSGRDRRGAASLSRSLSRTTMRLRAGFWKKRRGEAEEMDVRVTSCSAAAASSGRRDGASSPAMSPRRMSWEDRQAGADGAGVGGHHSHETEGVAECECETTTRHLDEAREREQRLSPVSVMDFPSQDGDDGNDDDGSNVHDGGGGEGHSEDDATSPTFERSLANIRRASQQLLQKIRQFEQLAELDMSDDVDDGTATTAYTNCDVDELNSTEDDRDADAGPVQVLLSLPEASSRCVTTTHCYKKLLEDFFRDGLSLCRNGRSDDPHMENSLLETAKAWLTGRHRGLESDGKVEVEEIERLVRWRCFREDERESLGFDVEAGIFCSLVEELVSDLC